MPVCVVLDSNIWFSNLLLRTPISLALLHGIVLADNRIALPEVIEKEILIRTKQRGTEILNDARKSIQLLKYYSEDANMAMDLLPTLDTISRALPKRLDELSKHIIRHEHSYSEMQKALDMVIRRLPPNSEKNQQYKDSLIWQCVLSIADDYFVHFITKDKGFFKDRSYTQGPADNICEDISSKKDRIRIYYELESCTEILHTFDRTLDEEVIYQRILQASKSEIDKHLLREGFFPKKRKNAALRSFFTNDPSKIAIQFNMEYELGELYRHEECQNAWLILGGNCLVSVENLEISHLKIESLGWSIHPMSSSSVSSSMREIEEWPGDGILIYGEMKE